MVSDKRFRDHAIAISPTIFKKLKAIGKRMVIQPNDIRITSEAGFLYEPSHEWVTRRGSVLGVSWCRHCKTYDHISLVTSPTGELNRAWRENLTHELTHAALFANGYAENTHHAIMKKAGLF